MLNCSRNVGTDQVMGINRPLGRTDRVRGWRLGIVLCAAGLVMALGAASDASAASKTICLGSVDLPACTGNGVADLPAAIAATVAGTNTIYIGSGDYSTVAGADFSTLGKAVKIYGIGPTQPVITMTVPAPGLNVVTLLDSLSSIDNVEIQIPDGAIGVTGLFAFGGQKVTNVTVTGSAMVGGRGIDLSGSGASIKRASIELSGTNTTGLYFHDTSLAKAEDVSVAGASTSVSLAGLNNFQVARLHSAAGNGIVATDSSGVISSCLMLPAPNTSDNDGGIGINVVSSAGDDQTVQVDNCTLVGAGIGSTGVRGAASLISSGLSVNVDSTIIHGYPVAAAEEHVVSSTASVGLAYSAYDGTLDGATLTGAGNHPDPADYGFADSSYRLALNSPLVDAGNPIPNASASPTDADDNPRVVSRGAGNIRDIGAFEVQNDAPVPSVRIVTSVPSTTVPTEFSAAGSTDSEGDALTYDWSFDGSPAPSGVSIKKLFPVEGPHSVQLTVTDKAGASATTSMQFSVARGYLPVKLRSQNARLTTKGTFKITLSCPAEAISNCSGRLLFQTAKKVNAKNYPNRPGWISKTSYLQAARYVFSIAPGTTKKLEVRTYSTFQNILAVKKKFKLVGSLVSGTTNNANLTANRATFTISAPKKRKR